MIESIAQNITNLFAAVRPQPTITPEQAQKVKLIAHRGAHSNAVTENTLAAFERAIELGAWGIELDVRWTKDHVPVVHHDPHCGRLFGKPHIEIENTAYKDLHEHIPEIPTLAEVVQVATNKVHLFIELKAPLKVFQEPILEKVLSSSTPQKGYHFLALDDQIFRSLSFVDNKAMVLVATTNTQIMSESALKNKFGGLCGHFYLLSSNIQVQHHALEQKIGLGFVTSKNALLYCAHRNCEWVFTDHLEEMINIIKFLQNGPR